MQITRSLAVAALAAALPLMTLPAAAATKSHKPNAATTVSVPDNSSSAQTFAVQEAERLEHRTRRAGKASPLARRETPVRQPSILARKAQPAVQAKARPVIEAKAQPVVEDGRAAAIDIPQTRAATRTSSRAAATGTPALRELVARHAASNGVPLGLAHGVVMVESRYNARATGPGGYIGLMQLSYRTAQGMGYKGSRAGLYDPDTNLRYGMKYLGGALKLAGGSTCGAVSKYQGGHGVRGVTRAGSVYCSKVRRHMAALPAESRQMAVNDAPKS